MITNNVDTCVDDFIEGYVKANRHLIKLPKHRVILRSDLKNIQGKVALLCGGGAGHEPAHAGYVGKGMLTGIISGSIFASPPPTSILAAIKAVSRYDPLGVILIVKNYTGDRLNFGLAKLWAEKEGIKTDVTIVGDDCADIPSDSIAGRRGLAAGIFVHKIAGAMAEKGKSMEEILKTIEAVKSNLGTIGICVKPCTLPNQKTPLFTLSNNEMELGLGIHGEAGVQRAILTSSKEVVKTMMEHMNASKNGLILNKDDKVAVIINNLGGLSNLEMGIICKDFHEYAEQHGILIERTYMGTFMTSLQMGGFSLSFIRNVNENELLEYLDSPSEVASPLLSYSNNIVMYDQVKAELEQWSSNEVMETITKYYNEDIDACNVMTKCIKECANALLSNVELLNRYDSGSGDGDCGTTHARCATSLLKLTDNQFKSPAEIFSRIAKICSEDMGGSSGAIYSILFSTITNELTTIDSLPEAFHKGIQTVKQFSGADLGDRTMIDVLEPISDYFKSKGLTDEAANYAKQLAEKTITMKARAGRASYVSGNLLKYPDPGAYAAYIIIKSFLNTRSY